LAQLAAANPVDWAEIRSFLTPEFHLESNVRPLPEKDLLPVDWTVPVHDSLHPDEVHELARLSPVGR